MIILEKRVDMGKIAIIIPARGGSKGIPQKNIKFLNNKPLIYYAIQNALSIKEADVFVSTEDKDIAHIARIFHSNVLTRDRYFDDNATLDEVIYYEISRLKYEYETIVTLQPTSPLLKKKTLQKAIDYFYQNNLTSLVSVSKFVHLSWQKEGTNYKKIYKERVNRQKLKPFFVENGAFVICKKEFLIKNKTRISDDIKLFEISENEAIDIDNQNDWVLAENILKRKKIAFIANGNIKVGMGHIYRTLTLSNKFYNDIVYFFCHKSDILGINKLKSLNYKVNIYSDREDLIVKLKSHNIDIVINDILDTDMLYIKSLKKEGFFVVNFEDTGSGSKYADIVFNALYEWSSSKNNNYYGYKYEVLREDIFLYPIAKNINKQLKNILVAFGGTDPNNATLKILKFLSKIKLKLNITVILGVGYIHHKELKQFMNTMTNNTIIIVENVKFMADYIVNQDLIVSGNGRMVYEIVALGIPSIVISQNEREMSHIFANICNGIKYLGYIDNVDEKIFIEAFLMCEKYEQRKSMNEELISFAKEIRLGTFEVSLIINKKYEEIKHET